MAELSLADVTPPDFLLEPRPVVELPNLHLEEHRYETTSGNLLGKWGGQLDYPVDNLDDFWPARWAF
jgi:hypothetical protein